MLQQLTIGTGLLLLVAVSAARAGGSETPRPADPPAASEPPGVVDPSALPGPQAFLPDPRSAVPEPQTVIPDPWTIEDPWLDRAQRGLHRTVSGSARRVDRLFGAEPTDERAYDRASGSIAPALLWDEFDGFRPKLRFRAYFPLPHINERFDAFIGRVNPEEYVTERAQESGAFPRQYGPMEEDETLLGISYREPPRQGGRFDAGAGVRVSFPLDPYIKGSYLYQWGDIDRLAIGLRETLFWRNSEQLGITNRLDLERLVFEQWLIRWTGSTTFSQESEGMRGYAAFVAMRGFPSRRALAIEASLDGETRAEVPLHDYGFKVAFRQAVLRDWLILEMRTSLRWPKEDPLAGRKPSWGVGVGFEMFFGTDEFLARPVTF